MRFEFSAKTAKTVMQTVEKTDQAIPETITETNVEPIAEPVTETNVEPITEPIAKTNVDPITEPIAKTITKPTTKPIPETVAKTATNTTTKPIGELVAAIIPDLNQMAQTTIEDTEKTVVVVDKIEKKKKPRAVPKAVGEVNIKACNNHFQSLSEQQQKDVLTVFYHMLKVGKIRNKANYFISLTHSAKEGSLTLPPPEQSQTPKAIAKRKAADEKREERATHWSNYCWIKEQAKLHNQSEEAFAKSMGFEDAYVLFGKQPALAA